MSKQSETYTWSEVIDALSGHMIPRTIEHIYDLSTRFSNSFAVYMTGDGFLFPVISDNVGFSAPIIKNHACILLCGFNGNPYGLHVQQKKVDSTEAEDPRAYIYFKTAKSIDTALVIENLKAVYALQKVPNKTDDFWDDLAYLFKKSDGYLDYIYCPNDTVIPAANYYFINKTYSITDKLRVVDLLAKTDRALNQYIQSLHDTKS